MFRLIRRSYSAHHIRSKASINFFEKMANAALQLTVVTHDKKREFTLEARESDTVGSVLATLRSQHGIPGNQSLVLQFRELQPARTLRSYLIGSKRGTTLELSAFDRRDHLKEIEGKVQTKWDENHCFETDVPADTTEPKYMITFPYPYMNGLLHVGHGFSLSKAEFAAGYQRLLGKNVLFPFAFHCTGMPIQACAQKLEREIAKFGLPPVFPAISAEAAQKAPEKAVKADPAAGKRKKKGKIAKKKSTALYQWEIMRELGVPEEEIASFAEPEKWLSYFPPLGLDHLKRFGLKADFRRAFITTDQNPFYNRFIEWQFNTLHKRGYVKFGKRMSVFSPLDGQPCADHDRASGEGVQPQEYTLIKMKVIPGPTPQTEVKSDELEEFYDRNIFLVAGTLRPETMYGQTNCFVFPNGNYVLLHVNEKDIYVCSEQSAMNMSYQDMTDRPRGDLKILKRIKGWDLLGRKLKAPNAQFDFVYTLPLLTISMTKATGVVTSVPADAPDDYIALQDLKKDAAFRKKYFITEEMVAFDAVPIIDIPGYGNMAAVKACQDLGIKNQHDTKKLAIAKDDVYMKGFHQGRMSIGPLAGRPVAEAKDAIRKQLIADGLAAAYFEPMTTVVARSGSVCVCANVDQWYLTYGTSPWKDKVMDHAMDTLETYSAVTKSKFRDAIDWMKQWACSRQFGLGTRLPFSKEWLIESLSDSTIYMAYYMVSHILQLNSLDGNDGSCPVEASKMTDAVWDHIYFGKDIPEDCEVPRDLLAKMRKEFCYWYPMDLRVSGKDLIGNHLIMSLYNHAAIWEDKPDLWPRSFFTNGHATINAEKMSKSTGNFLTLVEAIEQYGADATRLALADAGDGLEDANFSGDTCNAAILRLTKEEAWFTESLDSMDKLRTGPIESFWDKVFDNEIRKAVAESKNAYDNMQFRVALNRGFYNLSAARNNYITACEGEGLHKDLVDRYMETLLLILSPICPHWTEHIWALCGKEGLIVNARWPEAEKADLMLSRKADYLRDNAHRLRIAFRNSQKVRGGKKSKKKAPEPTPIPNAVYIYVAPEYPVIRQEVLKVLADCFEQKLDGDLSDEIIGRVQKEAVSIFKGRDDLKKSMREVMQFASFTLSELRTRGSSALELRTPFDERAVLDAQLGAVTRGLDLVDVQVFSTTETDLPGPKDKP
eukprot:607774_1